MDINERPEITVVMPVYNSDEYLDEAINSILRQTYKNFEFIIICDEPSDMARNILEKYRQTDSRIRVIYQERMGIIFSRNLGCSLANGEFIAVMDADDISLPDRFETLLSFMRNNEDIGIVGSNAFNINKEGKIIGSTRLPASPKVIGWHLFFGNCIYHATTLIRVDVLKKLNYYKQMPHGFPEDYDLWTRAFFTTKITNIPEILLKYRFHDHNNSIGVNSEIIQNSFTIQNIMHEKFMGSGFLNFLTMIHESNNSDILKFNSNYNKEQVKYLEELFSKFVETINPSYSETLQIKSYLSKLFMEYSVKEFKYSRKTSVYYWMKSMHYSFLTAIKESRHFIFGY